jgi:hypothetical protein
MINLNQAANRASGDLGPTALKRLWLWAPIAAGGTLALALMLAAGLPQVLEISRLLNHIKELEQQREQIDLLKLQSVKNKADSQLIRRQGEQLVRLVTGKGDLATVLATLDLEASQSRVQLQLYEPLAAGGKGNAGPGRRTPPPPPAPPAPGGGTLLPPAVKLPVVVPMAKAGLREHSLVLVARGTYPQLLDFLRRMEALDALVEQKDLTLTVEELQASVPSTKRLGSTPIVDLRLSLTLWSKEGEAQPGQPRPQTAPPSPVPPGPLPVPPAPPG